MLHGLPVAIGTYCNAAVIDDNLQPATHTLHTRNSEHCHFWPDATEYVCVISTGLLKSLVSDVKMNIIRNDTSWDHPIDD